MTTEVTICNSALIKLGAETIASLSDSSKEAELCNEQYTKIRDELLYDHPWNFATKSETLTSNGNSHPWNGYNEFDLPANYLRFLDFSDPYLKWMVEDNAAGVTKLYADDSPIDARYIFKQTDVTKFNPKFIELLSLKLALELSYTLVQSASLKQTVKQDYQEALRDARSFDGQEGNPGEVVNSSWIQIRQ